MKSNATQQQKINLLLVDDSLAFRQVFREIISGTDDICIVGEACNGIEALELILELKPDVVAMGLELPLMDGMTALQHLMIHVPTPTIILTSLPMEGTARAFDSFKNGAVDFVYKGSFLKGRSVIMSKELMVNKIRDACQVSVESIEPISRTELMASESLMSVNSVGFCEECGARIMIDQSAILRSKEVVCPSCGDRMDLALLQKHRRVSFLIVLGAGEGTFANILKIVPQISSSFAGAVIITMYGKQTHIDLFAKYLDSVSKITVKRFQDGTTLEGGTCYIASAQDKVYMLSHKTDYTLKSGSRKDVDGTGPLDLLMTSVSPIFKNRLMGVLLSGSECDGSEGLNTIRKNGGVAYLLNPKKCMHKVMAEHILNRETDKNGSSTIDLVDDEKTLSRMIEEMVDGAQKTVVTA